MVSHNPVKFGGRGCCDSGDMFQVAEEQDSHACLNPRLPLISKAHGMKAQYVMLISPILVTDFLGNG